ncbi:MAG: hypothetical protein KDI88_05205 [Gammaproteobacteria bacterium]|nr:hypothetical protein [Gammaproteobacteria bacterium]
MDRREFLVAAMASAGALALPPGVFSSPARRQRTPLVVHTLVLKPVRYFWEVGAWLEVVETSRGACLSTGDDTFGVGDALTVQLLESGMGHYKVALVRNGTVIRHFDSDVVGPLLERGEPLAALVTNVSGDRFRVDVYLDRAIEPGERIPLLDPAIEHSGTWANLVPGPDYMPLQPGWHPLRVERWHLPIGPIVADAVEQVGPYENVTIYRVEKPTRSMPIPEKRWMIHNDTPWPDLDPAAAFLTQSGRDVALLPYRVASNIEYLLLRGERVEAQVLKPGGLGEVRVDLSLVA